MSGTTTGRSTRVIGRWAVGAARLAPLIALLAGCPRRPEGAAVRDGKIVKPAASSASDGALVVGLSPETAVVGQDWSPTQAATLAALGAKLVRIQFCNWDVGGAHDAATAPRLAKIDSDVKIAEDAGLGVYAELGACTVLPQGKTKLDDLSNAERNAFWHAKFTAKGNAFAKLFAQAAGEIAAHFGSRVRYYEIWNEPGAAPQASPTATSIGQVDATNGDWADACTGYAYGLAFGKQGDWALCPDQLGVLTTQSYMAIKAQSPGAAVVAGNLLFHGEKNWVPKQYWQQMGKSEAVRWFHDNKATPGAPYPWDYVGIHPYNVVPSCGLSGDARKGRLDLAGELDDFRRYMAPDDPARIGISELGWPTQCPSGSCDADPQSPDAQAQFLTDSFAVARKKNVAFLLWFNYYDNADAQLYFGLRGPAGWKPSADAFCAAAGVGPDSCPTATRKLPTPTTCAPPALGPAPSGHCDQIQWDRSWAAGECEKGGNNACGGKGEIRNTEDGCDYCCNNPNFPDATIPDPPPVGSLSCKEMARVKGWKNPLCEIDLMPASVGVCDGRPHIDGGTSDGCDVCCDGGDPAP